ncbi:MAG TPA: glycerate kinase [Ignavibacteriaceae bacterium]
MTKRILISPNSFKECADAVTIAALVKHNLSRLMNTESILKPISDGGDGFLNVCQFHFGGEIRKYSISTAYNDTLFECPVLYCKDRKEVYIESAEVLGLKVVPLAYRNPLQLSSKGLGELLTKIHQDVHLNRIKVQRVYIGIGGTATIDMGIGMMSELGLKLFDSTNSELRVLPEYFLRTKVIKYEPINFSFEIIPVVDVTNPLIGDQSGIRIFGKQKGATDRTLSLLDEGFGNLLNLLKDNELQFSYNKLSGAGGGIPASLQIFYKTSLLPSSDFIKYNLGFQNFSDLDKFNYLITGEGAYDTQSGFGKGVGILLELFDSRAEQIFLICGKISEDTISTLQKNVIPIEISKYFDNEYESILRYKAGIEKACHEMLKHINF